MAPKGQYVRKSTTAAPQMVVGQDSLTVGGRRIELIIQDVPLDLVELDASNPRIRYQLQLDANGSKTLDEVILEIPQVGDLLRDIEMTGGLRERVLLQSIGRGHYRVREGNCRLTCFRALHKGNPDDPRWQSIPSKILPQDVPETSVAILLSDFHVAQKISWGAHEKAGHIFHMVEELRMPLEDVALILRTGPNQVKRLLETYRFMVDIFLKIDDGKYSTMGERRWSFFEEFFKNRELVEEYGQNPTFGEQFCRWVGEGKFQRSADVRQLPAVLKVPEARASLESGATFQNASKVLEAHAPEETSDFFKQLVGFTELVNSGGRVSDVRRIMTEQAAKDLVVAAYSALVGFMSLAHVDIPKELPPKLESGRQKVA